MRSSSTVCPPHARRLASFGRRHARSIWPAGLSGHCLRRSRALLRGIASRGEPRSGRRTAGHQAHHLAIWQACCHDLQPPCCLTWRGRSCTGAPAPDLPATWLPGFSLGTLSLPRASSQLQNPKMGWQALCCACWAPNQLQVSAAETAPDAKPLAAISKAGLVLRVLQITALKCHRQPAALSGLHAGLEGLL